MIRLARLDDAEALRGIERAAGASFAEVGLAAVAAAEPVAAEDLQSFAAAGRGWVVTDRVDAAHVEQVSAHPTRQGQRLGRLLIGAVSGGR